MLISGDKEAILVDAQFSLADAHRLVANLMESKKTLTTISSRTRTRITTSGST